MPLLNSLVFKFQSNPSGSGSLMVWLKAILTEHITYLSTVPNAVKALSKIYLTITSRLEVFKKLSKVSGRLDLVLSQVKKANRSAADGKFAEYDEDEDEEESDDDDDDDDDDDEEEGEEGEEEFGEEEDDDEDDEMNAGLDDMDDEDLDMDDDDEEDEGEDGEDDDEDDVEI